MNPLQTCSEIGLTPAQILRAEKLLQQSPPRNTELADLGHATNLGKQYANRWPDIQAPDAYLPWRTFTGVHLLCEALASAGAVPARPQPLLPFLDAGAPVKHLRQKLVQQLSAAHLEPWPTRRAPLPKLLLAIPAGSLAALTGDDDQPAVLGLQCQDNDHGIDLNWTCWGRAGFMWHSNGTEHRPASNPVSRLAWGVIGILNLEPEERIAATPSATGAIRNRNQRPAPRWLEKPVVYRREHQSEAVTRRGSPDPHWRKAHRHSYRCGPGRKQTRDLWLPAVWVDPEAEDSN